MAVKKNNTVKKTTRTKKPRVASKKLAKKASVSRWVIALFILAVSGAGIYLIYRSYAATRPNLRFQIQKNGVCATSVNKNDTMVNIKISRDSGTATINSITVKVDGNAVATSPNSINGPVTNLLVASPTLSESPTPHRITVTGNNVANGPVTFSAYCESNGSTSSAVAISAASTTPSTPPASSPVQPSEVSSQESRNNVRYDNFNRYRRYRTWEQTKMYDLDTLRVVRTIPALTVFNVSRIAYVNGGFFYTPPPSEVGGKNYGFYINTAYEINQEGRAVNRAGQVLDMRNNMPLSDHRTSGGECTSSRIWHNGLTNNLVAAVQRVELHLGREVPMNTAYRTYDEQVCLWNKYGQDTSRVAPPGQSNHNRGLAIDVDSNFANQYSGVMRQYGMCTPVPNEPWHFELCGGFK